MKKHDDSQMLPEEVDSRRMALLELEAAASGGLRALKVVLNETNSKSVLERFTVDKFSD